MERTTTAGTIESRADRAMFLAGGRPVEAGTAAFAEAIAKAHADHQRLRCLCTVDGVEMYVARLAGTSEGFIVKRMPGTGSRHAPDCPSYEPPPEASGLGQVLGSAITEDPATGETTLKLDFPLLKIGGRSPSAAASGESNRVVSSGTRLSLRGLLHYLWDQAELTRWHPGFAGRRSWGVVRAHLLRAAEHMRTNGGSLRSGLYVPEPFSVEQREAINSRRLTRWSRAISAPAKPQRLMLLIAEVKEIVPARYGFKAVVKHLPDQGFLLDDPLYRRLGRRFEAALAMWGGSDEFRMVMIATFGVAAIGIPTIIEMSLMPVTREWLPVEDVYEQLLVERLVADGRSFIKGLRYNLTTARASACATLTDCDGSPPLLFVAPADADQNGCWPPTPDALVPAWSWHPSIEPMPLLPPPRHRPERQVGNTAAEYQ